MKSTREILNSIRSWFRSDETTTLYDLQFGIYGGLCAEEQMSFSRVIFCNIYELLTDIANEVVWERKSGDITTFAAFRAFFDSWGQYCLNTLYEQGYCVIGKKANIFRILTPDDYLQVSENDKTRVKPKDSSTVVYVMKSQTFLNKQMSDYQLLHPFLKYLDNVLNSSNTVSARLGSMVIMSPQDPPQAPATTTLSKEKKEELEHSISESYGSLRNQKQIMLLQRPMQTQVINLAGLDQRTTEKAKLAILAICDRIKVPANQVAIIDSTSSKSFANGSELREGDLSKYRSFRRLLNATFWLMANDFGLQVDYHIENEPRTTQGDTINEAEHEI